MQQFVVIQTLESESFEQDRRLNQCTVCIKPNKIENIENRLLMILFHYFFDNCTELIVGYLIIKAISFLTFRLI